MKLDDKYTQQAGSVYLTGMQALVRLPIDQMRRDLAAGLNTATFISGYEGSPLGVMRNAVAFPWSLGEPRRRGVRAARSGQWGRVSGA